MTHRADIKAKALLASEEVEPRLSFQECEKLIALLDLDCLSDEPQLSESMNWAIQGKLYRMAKMTGEALDE